MLLCRPTGFLEQAQSQIEKARNARVRNSIVQPVSIAACGHDGSVGEPLQLIRDRLWRHVDRGREIGDADLAAAFECVEQPQACVVSEDLEYATEGRRFGAVNQRSIARSGLAGVSRD